jgi:putative transposase
VGRPLRLSLGGYAYHLLNRANGRIPIFRKDADYEAFEHVLEEALTHVPGMRLLAYCLMPNHWHLVVWPRHDGELSDFGHWLTLTHTQRWHAHRQNAGSGHLYQGRFKSFPVEADQHFLQLSLYVERNALRAGLVERAEAWRWSSLWRRVQKDRALLETLSDWPVARPRNWLAIVNGVQTETELAALRESVRRGRPYGAEDWTRKTAARMGLEITMRPRGRPRKMREEADEKGT